MTSRSAAMALTQPARPTWRWVVGAAIAGAWGLAVVAQLSGRAGMLHHDALIEGGPPIWISVPLFLAGWQVMVVGMMLPASVPAIRHLAAAARGATGRPGGALVRFLATYGLVWSAFGLAAFGGDVIVHRVVGATPWLAANAWLIDATLFAAAGAYQFMPWQRRSLEACRHPRGSSLADRTPSGPGAMGFRHALDCVGSSAALMVVMFGAGFANLAWMAALGAVMTYESNGRHGRRLASAVGVALIWLALYTVASSSRVV